MGNLLAYSGIVTKLKAMEARLLTTENFEEIASLQSVPDAVNYLRDNSSYAYVLNLLDESRLHRGDIEKILTRQLYHEYSKIYRFCGLKQREFLSLYVKRYEIDLINYCLRIVINRYAEPFDLNYKKEFFDRYTQISIEKLITSRTTNELIENLKDTEYYEPLHRLLDNPAVTLYDYDLTLSQYNLSTLWKKRKKILRKKELAFYTKICGSKIDLLNLQWIYRAKKYYNMEPANIYALLVPVRYKVSAEGIKEMIEAPGIEEYEALLRKTSYARHYDFGQKLTIEQMYSECLDRLYRGERRQNPYSIASITTYLFLKEEELRKLTTALECIRYGLSSGETLAYIGGKTQ